MKKLTLKQVIALSLTIILLTAICAFSAITIINLFNDKNIDNNLSSVPNIEDKDGNNIEGNLIDMPEELFINKIPLAAGDNGVSTTLKAVIKPLDSINQNVTWKIEWLLPQEKAVEDYVTLTVSTTDTKVVTVTCLQAFGNDEIIITVITEDGGFTATTKVLFRGYAESITVIDVPETMTTSSIFKDFNIQLQNRFNSFNYTPEYEVTVNGFYTDKARLLDIRDGTDTPWGSGSDTEDTVNSGVARYMLDRPRDYWSNGSISNPGGVYCIGTNRFIQTNILNNKLQIKPISLLKNVIVKATNDPTGNGVGLTLNGVSYEDLKYYSFHLLNSSNDPKQNTYVITVTEKKANVSCQYTVKIITGVDNVTIDKPVIEF